MEGSATFTIVASRTIMSIPAHRTYSASRRLRAVVGSAVAVIVGSSSGELRKGRGPERELIGHAVDGWRALPTAMVAAVARARPATSVSSVAYDATAWARVRRYGAAKPRYVSA